MTISIRAYLPSDYNILLEITKRSWAPVFAKLKPAVDGFVYENFYPKGWWVRQEADDSALLSDGETDVFVAQMTAGIVGYIGTRLHRDDNMGEIYILAVDPDAQRHGVSTALMEHAFAQIAAAGMKMVMVETGGDPGHAPSRAAYESVGFQRWPVARYFKKL